MQFIRNFTRAEQERRAEIARTTAGDGWDYILEMIIIPLNEARELCTQLRGDRLVEAQSRVATLQGLLNDIDQSGGRTDYVAPDELEEPDQENFTDDAYTYLGLAKIGNGE